MPIYSKSVNVGSENYPKYFCRKDFHHQHNRTWWSYVPKKSHRKVGNDRVRHFKGKIPDGNWYKKIYDLKWIIR